MSSKRKNLEFLKCLGFDSRECKICKNTFYPNPYEGFEKSDICDDCLMKVVFIPPPPKHEKTEKEIYIAAIRIVNIILDKAEISVEKRQKINDECDKMVMGEILSLINKDK